MMAQQKGFVLLVIMTMLGILSLLTLSSMQTVWLYLKTSQQRIRYDENHNQLEMLAKKIAENLLCRRHKINLQSKHAKVELQDLGEYSCLKIKMDGKYYASHHWLISVRSSWLPSKVLQVRVATPAHISTCQAGSQRIIESGMISWHSFLEDDHDILQGLKNVPN
jgi:hypothetical protein